MGAFARHRQIGADVEWIRPELAAFEIAERFFAPAEVPALVSLEGAARIRAFFARWTRKEAYIKAVGLGLSLDLDSFAISVAADEPPQFSRRSASDETKSSASAPAPGTSSS